jgi:hypothetical protein
VSITTTRRLRRPETQIDAKAGRKNTTDIVDCSGGGMISIGYFVLIQTLKHIQ